MEWTSAEEKRFSSMKELVKSYCQSGQLIELYTHLPCRPNSLEFGSTCSTPTTKKQLITLTAFCFENYCS